MSNVLYLLYDGITDPLGRSQVLPYLLGLVKMGYTVSILSIEKPEELSKHKETVLNILKPAKIQWDYLIYAQTIPVLTPFILANKLKNKAFELHHERNFQLVHCRSYMASLAGHALQQKHGIKFIFDMRGFWPDERVDGKVWNLKNPLYRLVYNYFKKKEFIFLRDADHTISLTHNGKDILLKRSDISLSEEKITVIPCCVDNEHFTPSKIDPIKKAAYREKLGLDGSEFVLSYLGSIGTWYMLDEMIDFFKVLLTKKPQAKFLFISKSAEIIKEKCTNRNIPLSSILIQPVPYDDVPSMLALSSASIFFILPVFSKRASSPVKQGEIMAMGIPIICNSNIGDTDAVIQKYNCGMVVPHFNDATYLSIIEKIDEITNIPALNGITGAREFYGLAVGIENYASVYAKLFSNQ